MRRATSSESSRRRRPHFHEDDVEEEEPPAHTSKGHRVHVERTRTPSFSYRNFRGKAYAKKADLEANVIHYVLQYARIVNEILRVPRIPDRDAEAKTRRLTDAFKLCILKNVDNALEDASSACCVQAGVKFEACRDLSRKLLASLKELKAFLRDEEEDSEAFEEFVEKHLSSKELSSLWSLGRATSRGLGVAAAAVLLILAYQYGVFPKAAEMLNLDAGLGSRILEALRSAGTGLHQGLGGMRASVIELLRPISESLMISNVMGAAAGLGAGVSQGVSRFLHGDASVPSSQPPVAEALGTSPRSIHDILSRPAAHSSQPSEPEALDTSPRSIHDILRRPVVSNAPGEELAREGLNPYFSPHRLPFGRALADARPHDNSKALVVYHAGSHDMSRRPVASHHTHHPISHLIQPDAHDFRHHGGMENFRVIWDSNITPSG